MRSDVVMSLDGDIFVLADKKSDKPVFRAILQENSRVIARFVVDENLTPAEQTEIVESFEADIAIPSGKLEMQARYSDDEEDEDIDRETVAIPKGCYRLGFHTTLPGPFAPAKLEKEYLDKYFVRTHPGKEKPSWLARESDSEDFWVGLIVHLTSIPAFEAPKGKPKAVRPGKGAAKPAVCPPGLASDKPRGWERYVQTTLHYIHKVPKLVAKLEPVAVEGGAATIPVGDLVLPYWIAWICGETHPWVSISCDASFSPNWPGFKDGIQATRTAEGWQIDIEGMNARWTPFGHLRQIAALLGDLPDGSHIEIACASNDDQRKKGRHRYLGPVRDGQWYIEQTYPAMKAAELRDMLALVRQGETGQRVEVRDTREANYIAQSIQKRDFLLRENPPKQTGLVFELSPTRPELMPFLIAWAYLARYPKTLPAITRGGDLRDWDKLMDEIAEAGAAYATGEVVLEGRFAKFARTDLDELEAVDKEGIRVFDDWLLEKGFEHLADLNSTQTFQATFRGYALPDEPVYAGVIANGFGSTSFEFFTPFPDGFTLTTTAAPKAESSTDKKTQMHIQKVPGDTEARWLAHVQKMEELAAKHGNPESTKGLQGFAQQLDDVFCRLHGI